MAGDGEECFDLDLTDTPEDSSFVRKLRTDLSLIPDMDRVRLCALYHT